MDTILITGASRGIGRATALLLAEQGYQIGVNYRQQADAAEEVVQSIIAAGGRAFSVAADISEEVQVVQMFQKLDIRGARLVGLINNAGILFQQCSLEALDAERINRVFATNVTGTFLCCREAVKRMGTHHGGQGGNIVNVSSAAARIGAPNEYVDYAASKGAVDTLTKGLSLEVAGYGIRVNGVRPGLIYTGMHADGGEAGRVDRIAPDLPLKRGGQPEEIARVIAWLMSDDASYVTGSIIDAAGGR